MCLEKILLGNIQIEVDQNQKYNYLKDLKKRVDCTTVKDKVLKCLEKAMNYTTTVYLNTTINKYFGVIARKYILNPLRI